MDGQLDIFHQPATETTDDEPDPMPVKPSLPLTQLPGTTWEHIFERRDEAA